MDLSSGAWSVGVVVFLGLSMLMAAAVSVVLFRRWWPWCGCAVCRAYVTCSWAKEFPNLSDWYAHLLRQSPTGTIHVHVLGCTVTANPGNVEYMLKTGFENFPKGKPFAAILGDLLGNGIFNVDGDVWRHQRKMASLELGSVNVRTYAYEIVVEEVQTRLMPVLADAADNGKVLDLQDVFRRFAFDTICKISFGLDPGCLQLHMPFSGMAVAFDAASRLSAMRGTAVSPMLWKMKRLLNIGGEKELKKAIKVVDELAASMIHERRRLGRRGASRPRHDLLSRFMASPEVDLDDKFLRDIVVSFLLAGRDTISSALTTLFMILSNNPAVTATMRAEAATGDGNESATYEKLKGMHYTHAVLYENMRLFPPVQFDSKFCAGDDVLPDGSFVEKNSRVMYHPYAMGRMPNIWGDDYEAFRPERWLAGPRGTFRPPVSLYEYPVFQAGLRVCLGKELAIMEMKAVSVAVVGAFAMEVVGENGSGSTAPKFVPGLTASIRGGLTVKVRRL